MVKRTLAYRVGRSNRDNTGCVMLTVQVYSMDKRDFIAEMAEWTHNAEQCEYSRQKACKAKAAHGKPWVFTADGRDNVELTWQGYRYDGDSEGRWIAPKIDGAYLDGSSITLLKLLLPAFVDSQKETQPADFIAYLQGKGAVAVRYDQALSEFVPDDAVDTTALLETESFVADRY